LSDAYLLVSHGSRDPRPQIVVDQLAQQLSLWLAESTLDTSPILVATAQLELADRPLHVQISDFGDNCVKIGVTRVVILPLFLSPGVHVMEDIPTEIAIAKREIAQGLKVIVAPFLGANADFANLFAQSRSGWPRQTIILAHGSRRSGGNEVVEQLANQLDVKAAYWSVTPSLNDRVAELVATGAVEIGILPYFLFAGGITDAIDELVARLRQQYPQVDLNLSGPIGNNPKLVAMIGKIIGSIDISEN
jgi:sirohydrochlorin cobaltochelatase